MRLFSALNYGLIMLLLASVLGCSATPPTSAPVVNAWQDPQAMKSRYRVQKNDTLYSIAWAFDLDYRDLATANHLSPPYHLEPGQTLTMSTPKQGSNEESISTKATPTTYAVNTLTSASTPSFQEIKKAPPLVAPKTGSDLRESVASKQSMTSEELTLPEIQIRSTQPNSNSLVLSAPHEGVALTESQSLKTAVVTQNVRSTPLKTGRWQWPARGKVIRGFSLQAGGNNKGIDIGGQLGDPILAIAPGKVVYSGTGLKGYGNLLIIKHTDNYLSAYAYNRKLLVKEGDIVKAGSEIGTMGQNDAGNTLLHFEIRRNGKPVDPLLYL
jgi:lipoprotein NlpD